MSNTSVNIGGLGGFLASTSRINATTDDTFQILGGQGVNIELVDFAQLVTLDGLPGLGPLNTKIGNTLDAIKDAKAAISSMKKQGDTLEDVLKTLKVFPHPVVRSVAKASDLGVDLTTASLDLIEFDLNLIGTTLTAIYVPFVTVEKITDTITIFENTRNVAAEVIQGERDAWAGAQARIEADFAGLDVDVAEPAFVIDTTAAFDAFSARIDAREARYAHVNQLVQDFSDFLASIVPDGVTDAVQWLLDEMNSLIDQVADVINGLGLDVVNGILGLLNPVSDAVGVLDQVREVVQPVIDVFGPVVKLINDAVESVEEALGLNDLEQRVEQAIEDAIASFTDPLKEELEQAIEAVEGLVASITEIFTDLIALVEELIQEVGGLVTSSPVDITTEVKPESAIDRQIIAGSDFDDTLVGTLDDDATDGFGALISGGGGSDFILGTAMADLLNGGAGLDLVRGLGGNDQIFGGSGTNRLLGDEGDDEIAGGNDADDISGGVGNDKIAGFGGNDWINGDTGNDLIDGGSGGDVLRAGAGNDTLLGGDGADTLYAGEGENLLDGQDGLDVIVTAGLSDAQHRTTDVSAKLIGGNGTDIIDLKDDLATGASIDAQAGFDGGGGRDRLEVGHFDAQSFAARFLNVEELRQVATEGQTKTLRTDVPGLLNFERLTFDGGGDHVINVTEGPFDMDAVSDTQPFLIDLSGLRRFDNPQDGGAGPSSSVLALTVALSDPAGSYFKGPTAQTSGLTVLGSDGDDTIIGGGGSDLIRAGLGADVISGGPSDSGNRFLLQGAVGDVILGSPEELDGDIIRDLSNRVDRVRIEGNAEYTLEAEDTTVDGEPAKLIRVSDNGAVVSTFTLVGDFPKLNFEADDAQFSGSYTDANGGTVNYVEVFNNNVPPTAVGESFEVDFELQPTNIDLFDNDFDADTQTEDGVDRRDIALVQSVELLFEDDIDIEDSDAIRARFDALGVAEGGSIETERGNRIDVVHSTDADGKDIYSLNYVTLFPDLTYRPFNADDPITQDARYTGSLGNFDVTEDLPFFGRDQLRYVVFDTEGEVSNIASVNILVRPGSLSILGLDVTGVDVDGNPAQTATFFQDEPTTGQGSKRISFTNDVNASLGTALGGNDRFDIAQMRIDNPSEFAFFGFSGNDYLDGRGETADLFLLGGNNADLVEGGAGDDYLSGGGLDNDIIVPNTRVTVDENGQQIGGEFPDSVDPNILIGGAGQNTYSASVDNPASGIDPQYTISRETIYILDRDGSDIITGPLVTAGTNTPTINIDLLPSYGPTALTAAALDGDTIVGFDRNNFLPDADHDYDQILLPLNKSPFTEAYFRPGKNGSSFFEVDSIPPETSIPRFSEVSAPARDAGLIVLATESEDSDALFDLAGLPSVFELDRQVVAAENTPFDFMIGVAPDAFLNRAITYDIRINDPDVVYPDGFTGAVDTTNTSVTVTLKSWDIYEDYRIVEEFNPNPDFLTFRLEAFRTFVRDDTLIDPLDIDGQEGLTFTFELEGTYQDRFVLDLAELTYTGGDPTRPVEAFVLSGARSSDAEGTPVMFDTDTLNNVDDYIGLSLSYVSNAPIGQEDAITVARGEAVAFDVFDNDSDADGDTLEVFDIVFDGSAGEEVLDGDLTNGEIIQQTNPETGFGTGLMTFVGDPGVIDQITFSYIATDGEFQTDLIRVTITQTGLPPHLSDDVIVLGVDALVNGATISVAGLMANDGDPDGDPLDPASFTLLQAGFAVGSEGITVSPADLAALSATPISADGVGGSPLTLDYTLADTDGAGVSDAARLQIFVADALALSDTGALEMLEDGQISIDLESLRSGGYGDLDIAQAVATSGGNSAGDVSFDGSRLTFAPLENLSGVPAMIEVIARDDTGQTVTRTLSVEIQPVDDAPVLTVLTPVGEGNSVVTQEDAAIAGTLSLIDVDLAAPLQPVATTLTTLNGGTVALTPTGAPGVFDYIYTPAADFGGDDSVTFDVISPNPGAVAEDVTLQLSVTPVQDAPDYLEDDFAFVLNIGATQTFSLLRGAIDVDSEIDPNSLEIINSNPGALSVTLEDIRDEDDNSLIDVIATLEGGASGAAELRYSVADEEGNRSTPVILSVDVNAPPEPEGDRAEIFGLGQAILIDAITNDTDTDGTISYVLDDTGTPRIIDPRIAFDDDSQPGLLGNVTWSAADQAFLYTPPEDAAAFGQTDVFFYEIEDNSGSVRRGTVFIDLFAEGEIAVRLASTTSAGPAEITATHLEEVFVLPAPDAKVMGTPENLDGDEIVGFDMGSEIVFEGIDLTGTVLTTARMREAAPTLNGVDINVGPSAENLLGNATQDELIAGFVGNTQVSITTPTTTSSVELSGAFSGAFSLEQGSVIVTYAPTRIGDGVVEGTNADDDLRGGTGGDTLLGLEGDDVLRGFEGDDDLKGGAGSDVLFAGAGENTLTGGTGADLFVLNDSSGTDMITDFNPFEGDRILVSDTMYLADGQNPDFDRLSVVQDGDAWVLMGDPNDEDVEEGDAEPDQILARFAVPQGLAFDAQTLDGAEDTEIIGNFNDLTTGIDAQNRVFALSSGPTFGSLQLDPSGAYTYTPESDFSGADSFDIQITLPTAIGDITVVSTVAVNVAPTDDAPVAQDSALSGTEDMMIVGQAIATDADSPQINFTVESGPANGALTLNTDGSFSYAPDQDFNGSDSFTFRASADGLFDTGVVSLTLAADNDAPVAIDDTGFAVNSSETLVLTSDVLLGNDVDVDGDALNVSSVRAVTGGTVALINGAVEFTPTAGFTGIATFTYVASDGQALSNMGVVDIDVQGNADPYADYYQGTDANEYLTVSRVGSTQIFGAGGKDGIVGANSDDRLAGGDGSDVIAGRRGADLLEGNAGGDVIYGGRGDDTIDGGSGYDFIFGGRGEDTFIFNDGNGIDRILDHARGRFSFGSDTDHIIIDVDGINSFDDLLAVGQTYRGATRFDFGDGDTLILRFVRLADLTEDDFTFI